MESTTLHGVTVGNVYQCSMLTAAESICRMENRGVTGDFENVLGHPLCITDEPDFQQAELNSAT